jgi:hypothetical protein
MTDDLKERWWVWHKDNPEFYDLFKRFTFEAIRKGHRRLSASTESMIVTTGNEYKISNDFIALYARLFMFEYQDYKGFFRTRPMKRVSIKGE